MSHRMKMNKHIITMVSPSGDAKRFESRCSGAFRHHNWRPALPAETLAAAVVLAKGCPSADNGHIRLLIRHPLSAAEQSLEPEKATNRPRGVSHRTISLAVEWNQEAS